MSRGDHPQSSPPNFWRTKYAIGLVVIGAVATYYLLTEHLGHVVGALSYLPYLLILACPLMHVFMHHGHGKHADHRDNSARGTGDSNQSNQAGQERWGQVLILSYSERNVTVLRRLNRSAILNKYPNLSAYVVRGEARPAFKRAFEAQLAIFTRKPATDG